MAKRIKTKINDDNNQRLRPQEAAEFLGIKVNTLSSWRTQSSRQLGPPYLKMGSRCFYVLSDLKEWLKNCKIDR